MRLTTLISDCDGVLLDSEVVAFEVLVRETQAIFPNIDAARFLNSVFGQKTESLVQQLAEQAQMPIPQGFLAHLRQVTDQSIETNSKVIANVEILIALPQLKAVVSNSGTNRVRSAARLAGVFERKDVHIFSADQVSHPKPAPDLYQLAAKQIGVDPERCLVIEDSLSGVVSARAAGMQVIGFVGGAHIPAGYDEKLRQEGVLDVFHQMTDLPQMLRFIAGW